MTYLVRPIDGNLGSAIAIRNGFGDENKLAVFADAGIMDCAKVGGDRCLLISRKQGMALAAALRQAGAFWDSIPYSAGPLRGEVGEDDIRLKYAADDPSGLRRMRFTRDAPAQFRGDGKVAIPFEFSINGPQWLRDKSHEKPLTAMARDVCIGVAVVDLDAEQLEMRAIRRRIELSPTALALIRLCDPLPPSIARFYARRDIHHDTGNGEVFARLELPQRRFLSPDLVTLQIRLAIQDICSGNVEADIFALYRLPLVREALRAGSFLALDLAEMIAGQLEQQAANPDLSGHAKIGDILEAIAAALEAGAPAEAALATELRRRAEVRQDR